MNEDHTPANQKRHNPKKARDIERITLLALKRKLVWQQLPDDHFVRRPVVGGNDGVDCCGCGGTYDQDAIMALLI